VVKQIKCLSVLIALILLNAWISNASVSINSPSSGATVSGTVEDQTGAVIPGAKIVLKNAASGDVRDTVEKLRTRDSKTTGRKRGST